LARRFYQELLEVAHDGTRHAALREAESYLGRTQ
jgi:hypothetical protein